MARKTESYANPLMDDKTAEAAAEEFVVTVVAAAMKYMGDTGVNPASVGEELVLIAQQAAGGPKVLREAIDPSIRDRIPEVKNWGGNRPEFALRFLGLARKFMQQTNPEQLADTLRGVMGSREARALVDKHLGSERGNEILDVVVKSGLTEVIKMDVSRKEAEEELKNNPAAIAINQDTGEVRGALIDHEGCDDPECPIHKPGGLVERIKALGSVQMSSLSKEDAMRLFRNVVLPTDKTKIN